MACSKVTYISSYIQDVTLAIEDKTSALEEYKILKTLALSKAIELFNAIYPQPICHS
jgi:hypothetical protein